MKHFLKMPPKKICLAMVGVLLSFCGIQAALPAPRTIGFRETEGGVEKTAWYVINRNQTGYRISITTNKGNEQIMEELLCDSAWRTSWWHYRSAGSSTDLTAKRSGDSIGLSGFLRGKPVTKTLCIDGNPWYQLVTMAMQTIAADSAIKARYWAVSIEGLAVLKAVPFRVATIIDTPLPGHPERAAGGCRPSSMGSSGDSGTATILSGRTTAASCTMRGIGWDPKAPMERLT